MRRKLKCKMMLRNTPKWILPSALVLIAVLFLGQGIWDYGAIVTQKKEPYPVQIQTQNVNDGTQLVKKEGIMQVSEYAEAQMNVSFKGKRADAEVIGEDAGLINSRIVFGTFYDSYAMRCIATKEMIRSLCKESENQETVIDYKDWVGKRIVLQNPSDMTNYYFMICGILEDDSDRQSQIYMSGKVLSQMMQEANIMDNGNGYQYVIQFEDYAAYKKYEADLMQMNVTIMNDETIATSWRIQDQKGFYEIILGVFSGSLGVVIFMKIRTREIQRRKNSDGYRLLGYTI